MVKLLRHVVLLKFKDDAKSEDVKICHDAFCAVGKNISCIKSFENGTNISKEGLDQGFTHCYLITFETEKDRDTYLQHQEHKSLEHLVDKHLEKVVVVDYWTQDA